MFPLALDLRDDFFMRWNATPATSQFDRIHQLIPNLYYSYAELEMTGDRTFVIFRLQGERSTY